jgi:hypothetical protein
VDIYGELRSALVPLDHHESDLYAKVTDESKKIIATYPYKNNVKRFTDAEGIEWFDIPFAYRPYWDDKIRRRP